MIFFVTDGVFSDNKAVIDAVARYNPYRGVRVHTLLCGDRPPGAERAMEKIAKENGGQYRYMSLE